MAWRTSPLPKTWRTVIRPAVLARDGYRCTWFPGGTVEGTDYTLSYTHPYRCTRRATDVDHVGDNTNHELSVLRALCSKHHASKTASLSGVKNKRNNNTSGRRETMLRGFTRENVKGGGTPLA